MTDRGAVRKIKASDVPRRSEYRRTLTEEEQEEFAYELALGYYTKDELRHVFKLLPAEFGKYLEREDMQVRVTQKLRQIDESDAALRIHARKAMRVAIDECAKLVKDEDAPAKTRMAAGKELREFAFAADKNAFKGEGAHPDGPIYLRTNLHMGADVQGVYTVKAEDAEEQVQEAMELEEVSEADEIAALLGA